MQVSIVIRTYNEQRHLAKLLKAIQSQSTNSLSYEVIIVDSGSTDKTLEIAQAYSCKIVHISREQFSFGRSLNIGCETASGNHLIFISGHCVPTDSDWLMNLVAPLIHGVVFLSYGRQIGGESSKFSECQLFKKYYSETSNLPQDGSFCNNANLALKRSVWEKYRFDENLTGLEDMHLGKRLVANGSKIGYVATATVYHYHNENWSNIKRRYEREAIALQHIMPEIHISFTDFLRYLTGALLLDAGAALQQKRFWKTIHTIFLFRLMQFWGSYRGNHEHRKLSKRKKELYFYPK